MAYFYVSAFKTAGNVAIGYPFHTERISVPGSSTAIVHPDSKATSVEKMIVRIGTDIDVQYLRGTSPTADAESEPLFAGQVEHIELVSGDKLSVIAKVA